MLRDTFDDIYEHDRWNGGSGPGSNPMHTREYVEFLDGILWDGHVDSLLDVGCGDWQLGQQFNLAGIRYKGLDVSQKAVSLAHMRAPRGTDISVGDIGDVTERFDLVHIKDVFQHLPFDEVRRILEASRRHRLVLVTNEYPAADFDIQAGQYRPIDVSQPPISFGKPILERVFNTYCFSKKALLFDTSNL